MPTVFSTDARRRGPRLRFRETAGGIVARSTAWIGWLLLGGGTVLVMVAATRSQQRSAWVGIAVGAGFALAGVLCAASRHAFELDWRRRTWREVDGLLRITKERTGTLDDFAAVVVSRHPRPTMTWPRHFSEPVNQSRSRAAPRVPRGVCERRGEFGGAPRPPDVLGDRARAP